MWCDLFTIPVEDYDDEDRLDDLNDLIEAEEWENMWD